MSTTNYFASHGMATLNNEIRTISGSEGWKSIAFKVKDSSSEPAIIRSENSDLIGGAPQGSILLYANEELTIGIGEEAIDGLIVEVPAGCVVYLVAYKRKEVV